MVNIESANELLKHRFPLETDTVVDTEHWGMRSLLLSGERLREFWTDLPAAIRKIGQKLPCDAVIANLDGHLLRMLPVSNPSASYYDFRDAYAIVFKSSEWPELPEGGRIPWLNDGQ